MSILEEEHFDPYHRLVNVKQDEYKGEFMRQALQRLPIFERTCFLLQIEGEFALEDVAEIMSESQERVASALCKAREHARQYYHELVRQEQQEAGPEKAVRHPLYVFSSLSQWIQGATEGRFWTFRAKPQPMSAFRQRPVSVLGTSRLVLIIAVVMLALLLNPFSMGHVAKADTLSLSMPSKSQTIYKLAWAHTVAWSTNGEDIATLWSDNTMQVWNARTGLESFHVNDIGWGAGLAFSPNDG